MRRFAVDTGPLVAFLNRDDEFHDWAVATLERHKPPLLACEATISEACFLLRRTPQGGDAVLEMLNRGLVTLPFRLTQELPAVRSLMSKYASVPMALADACLVRMAELDDELAVITLDRDFAIYRKHGRDALSVVMPPGRTR